jgi:hypothetical protein
MLAASLQLLYIYFNVSLHNSAKFTGRIQEIGIIKSKPSTSRFGTIQRNILGIRMEGLDGLYSIYNPQQNYSKYLNLLHVEDVVTIYYRHKAEPHKTELYQLVKGGETILRLNQYTYRMLFIGILALVMGLLIGWRITRKVIKRININTLTILNQ